MTQFVIKLILLLLSAIAVFIFKNPVINIISQTFAALFAGALFQSTYDNWRYIRFLPRLLLIRIQGGKLRVTFAALVRIKVNSDYLLIKSKRIADQWQPVGGVYKFFDQSKVNELNLRSDTGFKKTESNEFRLTFPSEHIFNALKLMKWFESQQGRETSPHREYKEELLDSNLLTGDQFANPNFEYLCRKYVLSFAQKFSVWELKIFEIFELKMNVEQVQSLKKLVDAQSGSLLLLDQKYIESAGFVDDSKDYKVGDQTKYIL